MEGLPYELYALCKQVFLDCDQFESYQRLRSFCRVHETLRYLSFEIENGASCEALFELNLPVFLDKEHERHGWALPNLIKALMIACPEGDARRSDLNNLHVQIKEHQNNSQDKKAKQQATPPSPQKLFNSIINIDFEEQESKVIDALHEKNCPHRTAPFLIHSRNRLGQEIMIARLLRLLDLTNGRKVTATRISDISHLWYSIARHFIAIDYSPSSNLIQDIICELVSTETLIFIFHEVPLPFLNKIIEEFWHPIIEKAKPKETHLVMFLINAGLEQEQKYELPFPLAGDFKDPQYPKYPLSLSVNNFTYKNVYKWLGEAIKDQIVSSDSILKKELLEMDDREQGYSPKDVYQKICAYYNYSWERDLEPCLTR